MSLVPLAMVGCALTFALVWFVGHVPLRVSLAVGVWIAAITFRIRGLLGSRAVSFVGLACTLASPIVFAIERRDLDHTLVEQTNYPNHHGDHGELDVLFDAFLAPFIGVPLVAFVAAAIAFWLVTRPERAHVDRRLPIASWMLAVVMAAAIAAAVVRARSTPGAFPRKLATSDLERGVVPPGWVAISPERWEIAGDESTLQIDRVTQEYEGRAYHRYDVSVRRLEGEVVSVREGLGPEIAIERDDRSDAWVVTEWSHGGSPPIAYRYLAKDGVPRVKLTVADMRKSVAAPTSAIAVAAIGDVLAMLLLAIAALRRRRADSIPWRSARIDAHEQIALDDGTALPIPDHAKAKAFAPGTAVLVAVDPTYERSESSAYRNVPRVTRVIAGTLEERRRAIHGAEMAMATCALAVLSNGSAPLLAAIALGIGVGS